MYCGLAFGVCGLVPVIKALPPPLPRKPWLERREKADCFCPPEGNLEGNCSKNGLQRINRLEVSVYSVCIGSVNIIGVCCLTCARYGDTTIKRLVIFKNCVYCRTWLGSTFEVLSSLGTVLSILILCILRKFGCYWTGNLWFGV